MLLWLNLASWNNILVASLSVGAVAAAFVGVSTYAVIKLQNAAESAAKVELEKYQADAATQITKALERAAEANRIAEEERTARAKMVGVLGQRRLTDEQGKKFMDAVREKLPPMHVLRIMDAEALNFGMDLIFTLRVARVVVTDALLPIPADGSGYMSGLIFMYDQKVPEQREAALLLNKLSAELKMDIILPCIGSPTTRDGSPVLPNVPLPSLYVGLKLPPFGDRPNWWINPRNWMPPAPK